MSRFALPQLTDLMDFRSSHPMEIAYVGPPIETAKRYRSFTLQNGITKPH